MLDYLSQMAKIRADLGSLKDHEHYDYLGTELGKNHYRLASSRCDSSRAKDPRSLPEDKNCALSGPSGHESPESTFGTGILTRKEQELSQQDEAIRDVLLNFSGPSGPEPSKPSLLARGGRPRMEQPSEHLISSSTHTSVYSSPPTQIAANKMNLASQVSEIDNLIVPSKELPQIQGNKLIILVLLCNSLICAFDGCTRQYTGKDTSTARSVIRHLARDHAKTVEIDYRFLLFHCSRTRSLPNQKCPTSCDHRAPKIRHPKLRSVTNPILISTKTVNLDEKTLDPEDLCLSPSAVDLKKLADPNGWLDDSIIMNYLNEHIILLDKKAIIIDPLLWEKENFKGSSKKYARPKFREDWSRAVFPIHQGGNHWVLAIAEKQGEVLFYNTMGGVLFPEVESKLKKIVQEIRSDASTVVIKRVNPKTFYIQLDGNSCGPARCLLAERIVHAAITGASPTLKFTLYETKEWRKHALIYFKNKLPDVVVTPSQDPKLAARPKNFSKKEEPIPTSKHKIVSKPILHTSQHHKYSQNSASLPTQQNQPKGKQLTLPVKVYQTIKSELNKHQTWEEFSKTCFKLTAMIKCLKEGKDPFIETNLHLQRMKSKKSEQRQVKDPIADVKPPTTSYIMKLYNRHKKKAIEEIVGKSSIQCEIDPKTVTEFFKNLYKATGCKRFTEFEKVVEKPARLNKVMMALASTLPYSEAPSIKLQTRRKNWRPHGLTCLTPLGLFRTMPSYKLSKVLASQTTSSASSVTYILTRPPPSQTRRPSSPTLFNLAIEPILRCFKSQFQDSLKLHDVSIGPLAFADDLAIVGKTVEELQCMLNTIDRLAKNRGLRFNAKKCASLHISKGQIHPTKFKICGEEISTLKDHDHYVYLGTELGKNVRSNLKAKAEQILDDLKRIEESMLAPWQKIDAIKVFIITKMIHSIRHGDPYIGDLKELDRAIKFTVRTCCKLPHLGTPEHYIYGSIEKGGLGIASLEEEYHLQSLNSISRLLYSQDPKIRTYFNRFIKSSAKKWLGKGQLDVTKEEICDLLNGKTTEGYNPFVANHESHTLISRIRRSTRALGHKKRGFMKCQFYYDNDELLLAIQIVDGKDYTLSPRQKFKFYALLRKLLVENHIYILNSSKYKLAGSSTKSIQLCSESSNFNKKGHGITFSGYNFIHKARLGLHVLNGSNRLTKERKQKTPEEMKCRRCGYDRETLNHVLSHCFVTMDLK
uniref:Ubiquitin-like protease family profile domain-containing protein n=1 Tax=Acrobeloides nanus TaxID=290746 RepID=A0A914D4E2_9BILA